MYTYSCIVAIQQIYLSIYLSSINKNIPNNLYMHLINILYNCIYQWNCLNTSVHKSQICMSFTYSLRAFLWKKSPNYENTSKFFTGQYLNFNSHHPYTIKKGITRCLQHRANTISSDTDAYQEEMISLRHNLHRNNYPESITSAPRNLDRRVEDNTRKLTTVCLPYVKGLAERIKKICSPYDIRTVFTSGSTLRRYLFRVKPEWNSTWLRTVFTPSLAVVVKYTKVRQVAH